MKIALLEFSLLVFVATVFKSRSVGWMDYVVGMEGKSKAYNDIVGIRSEADDV